MFCLLFVKQIVEFSLFFSFFAIQAENAEERKKMEADIIRRGSVVAAKAAGAGAGADRAVDAAGLMLLASTAS